MFKSLARTLGLSSKTSSKDKEKDRKRKEKERAARKVAKYEAKKAARRATNDNDDVSAVSSADSSMASESDVSVNMGDVYSSGNKGKKSNPPSKFTSTSKANKSADIAYDKYGQLIHEQSEESESDVDNDNDSRGEYFDHRYTIDEIAREKVRDEFDNGNSPNTQINQNEEHPNSQFCWNLDNWEASRTLAVFYAKYNPERLDLVGEIAEGYVIMGDI